jgi:hypothetical protein
LAPPECDIYYVYYPVYILKLNACEDFSPGVISPENTGRESVQPFHTVRAAACQSFSR